MSLAQHVKFLVDNLGLSAEDAAWCKQHLNNPTDENLEAVLTRLHGYEANVRRRLQDQWSLRGEQVVVPWMVPALAGVDARACGRKMSELLRAPVRVGSSHQPQQRLRPGQSRTRPLLLQLFPEHLNAKMRIAHKRSVRFEQHIHEVYETKDVSLSIVFGARPYALVFASGQDASLAIRAFIEWYLGRTLPQARSNEFRLHLSRLAYSESVLKACAARLSWEFIGIHGLDATGEVGEVQFLGKKVGTALNLLETHIQKVAVQDQASNMRRSYAATFGHPDGFAERAQIEFLVEGDNRLKTLGHCSRAAVSHAAAELVREIYG